MYSTFHGPGPAVFPTESAAPSESIAPSFEPSVSQAPSSILDCPVVNNVDVLWNVPALTNTVNVIFDEPTVASPALSMGCLSPPIDPAPALPDTTPSIGAKVSAFIRLVRQGCLTVCFGLGTCALRDLVVGFYDSGITNNGVDVYLGDIRTGLMAITGVLPADGSLTCVSFTNVPAGSEIFFLDTDAGNSGSTSCFPEFSVFQNAVCIT